jgi:hypothetical protein
LFAFRIFMSLTQITKGNLRDGVDLTQIEHILEYLTSDTCRLETRCDSATAKNIKKHAEFFPRLFASSKVQFVIGFDHQVMQSPSLSKHTHAAALEGLKTSITNHLDVLLSKIQSKLPTAMITLANVPVAKTPSLTNKVKPASKRDDEANRGITTATATKRPLYSTILEERNKKARMEGGGSGSGSDGRDSTPKGSVAPSASVVTRKTSAPSATATASGGSSFSTPKPVRTTSNDVISRLISGDTTALRDIPTTASTQSSSSAGSNSSAEPSSVSSSSGPSGAGSSASHKPLMNLPQRAHAKGAVMLDRPGPAAPAKVSRVSLIVDYYCQP